MARKSAQTTKSVAAARTKGQVRTFLVPRTGVHAARGFTLIELMITVAIIAIIAAIAIPSLLHARMAANESSAISTSRTIVSVNEQYRVRFGQYASSLNDLYAEGYIDSSVANPLKAGYTFGYTSTGGAYTFNGNPSTPGQSGNRYFFVDPTGVIRFSSVGAATSADAALNG